jgi:hypothetical protein
MKARSAALVTVCALLATTTAWCAEAAPPPPAAKDAATLVRELADEQYKVREQATRELWKLGDDALAALEEASRSPDPERMLRARELVRKIQLRITPETDPVIASAVERYLKSSSISEKTSLLEKLVSRRAWHQTLKLYAAEKAEAREALAPKIEGVATRAARERLAQGDPAGARAFLELAPATQDALIALASFHLEQGTWQEELRRARETPGPRSAAWQLALHRVAGNLEAARSAADAANEPIIAGAMAAIAGDPLPWLTTKESKNHPSETGVNRAYAAAAASRWQGKPIADTDLALLTRTLSARTAETRLVAMNTMFLLGETTRAEAALVKQNPLAAFRHFEAQERIPEALRALGIDPASPDFSAWAMQRMERMAKLEEDVEDQHEASDDEGELVALAAFLERRGLHDAAFDAFQKPLEALAAKDDDDFVSFLDGLFGDDEEQPGAPRLARRIGAAWAGDQPERWTQLVAASCGDDDLASGWWDWLAEIAPDTGLADRFDALLALFKLGTDPDHRRERWLDRAWKALEQTPPDQRQKPAARIAALANRTGDAAASIRAMKISEAAVRRSTFWYLRIHQLSALGRWQEAAKVILEQIEKQPSSKAEPSAELHAYAAAALRMAGDETAAARHDALASRLHLGDIEAALGISQAYAFGEDSIRAAQWWAKGTLTADPHSPIFRYFLKAHSDELLRQGRWKEAAATAEVLALVWVRAGADEENPLPLLRQRVQADTARALARLATDRAAALATLEACHKALLTDGSLADFFFPALRRAGLTREHDRWFDTTWAAIGKVIDEQPESDNTLNTAAWLASRAARRLDEGARLIDKALAQRPDQAAYLDTRAEIEFARGNRTKALEWSSKAVNFEPLDAQLRQQRERFRRETAAR